MKKILDIIWKFINSKFFGYALVILCIIIIASQCQRNTNLKRDNIKKEQNILAAKSTITEYKNKEGTYIAEKAIWILTERELKEQNSELSKLVGEQKGRIISLNNAVFRLKQDTTILHDSINYLNSIIGKAIQINKTDWEIPWELQYTWDRKNFDYFKGHSTVRLDTTTMKVTHLNTLLDERDSRIELTFGEKVVDGKYNVFVMTNYPGLTAESMNGVFIDPNTNKDIKKLIEKRHWFTGFSVSIGITPGWDFINNKVTIVVGPTVGWNVYQF